MQNLSATNEDIITPLRVFGNNLSKYTNASKLRIIDLTLREGQHWWGFLSTDELLVLYNLLVEINRLLGRKIIVGTELYLYTSKDKELVRIIKENSHGIKPIGWIRASYEDLKLALELGLEEVSILTSISEYHIRYKLGLSKDKAFSKYLGVVEESLKRGLKVRCILEDVTRAYPHLTIIPFVKELLRLSEKYDSEIKLRLEDTLGIGLPLPNVPPPIGLIQLVKSLSNVVSIDRIEFHGHNDLGLAIANYLALWSLGVSSLSCTLLGVSDKSTTCPLEVMLMYYVSTDSTIDVHVFKRIVEKINSTIVRLNLRKPNLHPFMDRDLFKITAGIIIDGVLKNKYIYYPYDPSELLGISHRVLITPYSGRSSVLYILNTLNGHEEMRIRLSKRSSVTDKLYEYIVRYFEGRLRREPLGEKELKRVLKKYLSIRYTLNSPIHPITTELNR